ncbi:MULTISPECIES: ABC transporter ATP-binding protein [unclassified Nostoc]|uniref:ABC transporter ATP-binding protein n=1 Tax=unclassified Nostoc TaxID=2593658 RepID=UPI002AD4AD0A|nr:ABC transporter ATP-binding protein [Nostoc sp. DedQUE03]MDZ7975483.1 ABC transporter ATP-binding protein [Nostoc sp. DedQUE03]MDZ8045532.1 ABC transporter ATP-binding protein [Nostoc sp. DedQUE02]
MLTSLFTENLHCQLSANNLTLGYDKKNIINNLNLNIPSGKITVLVGANGCGKSTLLQGLARLIKPNIGTVYLDTADIFNLSTKEVAKKLGILTQSPIAPEGLTVRDLVACGRFPYQNWLQQWTKEDERLVELALEITGIKDLGERELDTLSGGQRQRAWIAMALAQNTDILLLDEPTTFLDLAHQIEVLDLLYDLNQNQRRTIVMVLHDLNHACRYADYLVAVKEGQIFAVGEPNLVMTEKMVREVFGLECRIIPDPVSGTPMCIPVGRKGRR